jgi:hypothetical protein
MMNKKICFSIISFLVLIISQKLSGQSPLFWGDNTPIDSVTASKIKEQVEERILRYKMITNPVITQEKYIKYQHNARVTLSPYNIIFDPPFTNNVYEMVMDIERWPEPERDDNRIMKNFYLLTKKGNRFTNTIPSDIKYNGEPFDFNKNVGDNIFDWKSIPAYSDTITFDLWDSYFPYDERYVIYYDSAQNTIHHVGGALVLEPIKFRNWFEGEGISLNSSANFSVWMRLDRFGVKIGDYMALDFLKEFAKMDSINPFSPMNGDKEKGINNFYFIIESFAPNEGFPALAKTTAEKNYYNGEVELTYYNGRAERGDTINGEIQYLEKWQEVKWLLKNYPVSYEETLPKIRELSKEEVAEIRKTPYTIFIEPHFLTAKFSKLIDEDLPDVDNE